MKKILSAVLVLCMTGCFLAQKPMDVLNEFENKLENVKSLEVEINVKGSFKSEGTTVSIDVPITLKAEEKENLSLLMLELGDNPLVGEQKAYAKIEETGAISAYFSSSLLDFIFGSMIDETLIYYEGNLNDLTDTDTKEITLDEYVKEEDLKYIDSDGNIKHYQLTVNQELLDKLNSESEEKISLKSDIIVDYYINTKTYDSFKMVIDIKDIISKIDIEDIDYSSLEELSITVEFKNFDNVTVTLPNTDNAITIEEYMNSLEYDDFCDDEFCEYDEA